MSIALYAMYKFKGIICTVIRNSADLHKKRYNTSSAKIYTFTVYKMVDIFCKDVHTAAAKSLIRNDSMMPALCSITVAPSFPL